MVSIFTIGVEELTGKKTLQDKSEYSYLDYDGDNQVSDKELETHHRIMEAKREELQIEHAEKMLDQQRYLCWVSSISSIAFLLILLTPIIPLQRVEMVTALLSTYVVANVGIVSSFVISTAWARKNGKG
jgi:hypothetical protein